VTVGTDRGALTLPAAITEMPDGVVWLPTNSPGSTVRRSLGATSGSVVRVSAATEPATATERVAADAADRPGPLLNTGGVSQ
jgi:NADH-quinone oxidoreductase subunit G